MQIIEEAKRRRTELQAEIDIIDRLLEFHGATLPTELIDANITVFESVRMKLLSVRTANAVVSHPALGDRKTSDIKLHEIVPLMNNEVEFLKLPNFGRKSLNELKDLVKRLNTTTSESV